MLSCSDIQTIQSLANKPLLSQFPESVCSQCSTLTKLCDAFGVHQVVCSLQDSSIAVALKHDVYDYGGF